MPRELSKVASAISPSATLRLNALATQMRQRGMDIISLAAGEPDFDSPRAANEAAIAAINSGQTHYTPAGGLPALRLVLSDHIRQHKGLSYRPDEVMVGTGAKQLLQQGLYAILNPGDEVLLPAPYWLSYPEMIRMAHGVPVPVMGEADRDYIPTVATLEKAITPRTKAIIINSPNNPTGAVWDEDTLRAVAKMAEEHDLYIISDEIYERFVFEGAGHVSVASLSIDAYQRTLVVSGFSKTYAMTGWRLGTAAGPRPLIAAMEAWQSHATGNPNTPAQYAALAALNEAQGDVKCMHEAFEQRRLAALRAFGSLPKVTINRPRGAFYLLMDLRPLIGLCFEGQKLGTASAVTEAMLEHARVSLIPCESFGLPGFARLSYALPEDKLQEAADRMQGFIEGLTSQPL